ncbi:MAG: hypothetical protein ACLGXA_24530 [Acidobacteriota bacterium]
MAHRRRNRKKPQHKSDPVTYRTAPDEVLLSHMKPEHRVWPVAPSLRVGPPVMDAVVAGSPEAAAIADSYQFRFPVTVVTA